MNLQLTALGQVALVGAGATLAIVIIFASGVLTSSMRETAREQGGSGKAALAVASVCFGVCAAAVVYGIYLIIPHFHK